MEFETFKEELLDHLRQITGRREKNLLFSLWKRTMGSREEAVVILEEGARIAPTHLS